MELQIKIENLKRELSSKNSEIESIKSIKDEEGKKSKKNYEKYIKEKDKEIAQIEE